MHSITDPGKKNYSFGKGLHFKSIYTMFLNQKVQYCTGVLKAEILDHFNWNTSSLFPDFVASFLSLVIPFLLCQQCQGKDDPCTNDRCLNQTFPFHPKALSRNIMIPCMNTTPWLVVPPAKAFPLRWWSNKNPEILHMIQVSPGFNRMIFGNTICLSLWFFSQSFTPRLCAQH